MNDPLTPKSWWKACAGLVAGAGLVGLAHGAFASWNGTFWERTVSAMAGNWVVAGMLGLILAVFALVPALRVRLPRPATAFWMGAAIGVAPVLSEFTASTPVWAAGAAVVFVVAFWLGERGPATRAIVALAVAVLLVAVGGTLIALRPVEPEPDAKDPLAFPAQREDPAPSGPDVLLISIDTLRADAIVGERPAGYELPTLDRLRAEGLWADYALSSSNQTLPGHLGMLTGLDAMDHGTRYNLDRVPFGQHPLAARFLEGGYHTAGVVSNPLISGEIGFSRGFEVYDDTKVVGRGRVRDFVNGLDPHSWLGWFVSDKNLIRLMDFTLMRAVREAQASSENKVKGRGRAEVTNQQAHHLLDTLLEEERPYFLFVHYMDAHAPYGPPDPWMGKLTAALPPLTEKRYQSSKPDGRYTSLELLNAQDVLREGGDKAAARAAIRFFHYTYLEEVMWLDHKIGELLERIAQRGRPTVVLVTSDHGEHFGEHQLMTHANSLYEENLRVPFILWGPGVPQKKLESPAKLFDVAPTLLGLAGLEDQLEGLYGFRVYEQPVTPRVHVAVDLNRFSLSENGRKWISEWSEGKLDARELGLFRLDGDPATGIDVKVGEAKEPPEDLAGAIREALSRDHYQAGAISAQQMEDAAGLGYVDGIEEDD